MKNITKDNKGITLIALIITVVLMLILISVTTYTGLDTYRHSKVNKYIAQMQLLQTKIDDLVSTKTEQELNSLSLPAVTTTEQTNAITNAFKQEEVSTADTSKYKVFTEQNILNILDIEDVGAEILVNFETREILSTIGIEYENQIYYTQYKLPGGQTIINNDNPITRNLSFELKQEIDGLNCKITIQEISIINGTVSYAEVDSLGNKIDWKTITNYSEKNKEYEANISKSGDYIFKIQDNTYPDNNFEKTITITLTNKPKTNLNLNPYNYGGENSNTWAYVQKNSLNYVWIPRFVYKTNTETSGVDIKFIKGNSNIATDNTYIDNTWNIHEEFTTSNGVQLTGIWINVNNLNQTGLDMITLLESNAQTLIEI